MNTDGNTKSYDLGWPTTDECVETLLLLVEAVKESNNVRHFTFLSSCDTIDTKDDKPPFSYKRMPDGWVNLTLNLSFKVKENENNGKP